MKKIIVIAIIAAGLAIIPAAETTVETKASSVHSDISAEEIGNTEVDNEESVYEYCQANSNSNDKTESDGDSNREIKRNSPKERKEEASSVAKGSTVVHEHKWEPVYETMMVDDIASELHEYCKGCGADITSWSNSKRIEHSNNHLEKSEQSGFYEKEFKVVTGSHAISKRIGWKCECGATK